VPLGCVESDEGVEPLSGVGDDEDMLDSCWPNGIEPPLVLDVGLNPGANGAEPGAVIGDEAGPVVGDEPGAVVGDEPGAVIGDEPGAVIGDANGAGAGVEPGATVAVEPGAVVGEPGPVSGFWPGAEDAPGADEGDDVMSMDEGVVDEFRGVEASGVEFDGVLVEFWPSATDPLLGLGVAKLPLLLTQPMGSGWRRIGAIRLDPSAAKLVANVLMLLASERLRRRGA